MKVTIDLRHLAVCLICAALGFGLHAFAAPPPVVIPNPPPPPTEAFHATLPAQPAVGKWEFMCVNHKAVGVASNWANDDLDKADGWNPYFAKMGKQGWEPAVLMAPNGIIGAVCFRRPLVEKAVAPKTPPGPPLAGSRCSAADVADMQAGGMSQSAIDKACKAP